MTSWIEVGMLVRLPSAPEWAVGQVQSVDGNRVTVNFPHAGKQCIDSEAVELVVEADDPAVRRAEDDAD